MIRSTRRAVAIATVFVVALATSAGCSPSDDGSTAVSAPVSPAPVSPSPVSTVSDTPDEAPPGTTEGVRPEGFASTAAVVTTADGATCEVCLWVAEDPTDRARGLMGVTDLGGRDGMAFLYDQPTSTSFTMRNTLLPLSIVFFGADGAYLDAFDMTPCTAEPCTSYPTPEGFTVAVEVPRGGAEGLGMEPVSRIEVLDAACP